MKPTRKLWRKGFSSLVLFFTIWGSHDFVQAQDQSASAGPAKLGITLRMYNYAISRALLSHAEDEAATLLDRTGIHVTWLDCPTNSAGLLNDPECAAPMQGTDFVLRIITAEKAELLPAHHEAMGAALQCLRQEVGCSSYVFYRDVQKLAREGDASESQLLGHALAHEVGHLLLGPNTHSPVGIMRAGWNEQDLHRISRDGLRFTSEQAGQIRRAVLALNEHDTLAAK